MNLHYFEYGTEQQRSGEISSPLTLSDFFATNCMKFNGKNGNLYQISNASLDVTLYSDPSLRTVKSVSHFLRGATVNYPLAH